MAAEVIERYEDLERELEDARSTLICLNDNIRRIVGRNLKDIRTDKIKLNEVNKDEVNRQSVPLSEGYKNKKKSSEAKSVFNRLSAPNQRSFETEARPRVNSRVIRELPTRQEIVAAQGGDSESRARNRRIFGSLIGTLHKFCQEESRLKQKEEKKAQIEKKLEEQEMQERQQIKKERETLFLDRKKKQLEIRKIELKMSRLKDIEVWESSLRYVRNNIRTKAKPHLYYRPRIMSSLTESLLSESQAAGDAMKKQKLNDLKRELVQYDAKFKLPDISFENSEKIYLLNPNSNTETNEVQQC